MQDKLSLDGSNPEARMSALGQKRTLKRLHPMSALPPKADISQRSDLMSFQSSIISFVLPPCR
jgi:hypothetical protein